MKWLKKTVFDVISPVVNALVMTPDAALARPDGGVNVRNVFRRQVTDSADTRGTVIKPTRFGTVQRLPLVKASTSIADVCQSTLKQKSVFCIGGQIQLYPAYRQIVEDAGGRFMSFHGAADSIHADEADLSELRARLNQADMIICPLDCIRHDMFFVVREYCIHSGKPCVMLDKSRITTFYNGIRHLKKWISS